jgi:hypothetical protein
MKEFVDAVNDRIKTPYFGYSVLAFLALNWKGIFLLLATTGEPAIRIAAFENQTSFFTLVLAPLAAGAIVAASTHWIKLGFELLAREPLGKLDLLALEAEHEKTIKQKKLEQELSELFAIKEEELIERATRDAKVEEIEDESAKENLNRELEQLRKERDLLSKREGIVKRHGSEVESLEKLEQSHRNMSELNRQMKKYEEAKAHEEEALVIRKKIAKLSGGKF